jgi:hypothetical protein
MATTTNTTTPEAMFGFLKAAGEDENAQAMAQLAMTRDQDTIKNANVEDIAAMQSASSAQGIITAAKNSYEADATAANNIAANALGLNPQAANYRLNKLAAEGQDAYEKMSAARDRVHAKMSVQFTDSPLEFIHNQFTLPADIEENNYYANKHQAAGDEYARIVDAGTATGREVAALKATMSLAQSDAEQKKIVAEGISNIAKVKAAAAGTDIQVTAELAKVSTQQLAVYHTVLAANQKRDELAASAAQLVFMNEQRAQFAADREMKLSDLQAQSDAYNAAAEARGFAKLSYTAVDALVRRGGVPGADTNHMIGYGQQILQKGGKGGVAFATDPATAVDMLARKGAQPIGIDAPILNTVHDMTVKLLADPALVGAIKDPREKLAVVGAQIKKIAADELDAIGDDAKFYGVNSPVTITTQFPDLATRPIVQQLLAQAAASPTAQITVDKIHAAAIGLVEANPSSLDETSRDVLAYMKANIEFNNRYKSLGEIGLPVQDKFIARVHSGVLGRASNIDYSDLLKIKSDIMLGNYRSIKQQFSDAGQTISSGVDSSSAFLGRVGSKLANDSYGKSMVGETARYDAKMNAPKGGN